MSQIPDETDDVIQRTLDASGIDVPDADHARRCARFAGKLFDAVHDKLQLDAGDRDLAILAALFHDVGYLRGSRDHHRKSFDVIREATIPNIAADERLIVACAARYHGRSLPNIEHAGFGFMDEADQHRVRRLSAIVRVAVALDASHLGTIQDVEVRGQNDTLTLVAYAHHEPAIERDRLRESAGGFRELTYLPLNVLIEHRWGTE